MDQDTEIDFSQEIEVVGTTTPVDANQLPSRLSPVYSQNGHFYVRIDGKFLPYKWFETDCESGQSERIEPFFYHPDKLLAATNEGILYLLPDELNEKLRSHYNQSMLKIDSLHYQIENELLGAYRATQSDIIILCLHGIGYPYIEPTEKNVTVFLDEIPESIRPFAVYGAMLLSSKGIVVRIHNTSPLLMRKQDKCL